MLLIHFNFELIRQNNRCFLSAYVLYIYVIERFGNITEYCIAYFPRVSTGLISDITVDIHFDCVYTAAYVRLVNYSESLTARTRRSYSAAVRVHTAFIHSNYTVDTCFPLFVGFLSDVLNLIFHHLKESSFVETSYGHETIEKVRQAKVETSQKAYRFLAAFVRLVGSIKHYALYYTFVYK